jgi:hypothetical protein
MSKGFGKMQMCLLSVVGVKPMSFEQIFTAIAPDIPNASGIARNSNFSVTRSLRRALGRLVDLDIIQIRGRRPHRYNLNPLFRGDEYDPVRISLGYKCLSYEEGDTLSEKNANMGRTFAKIANAVADLKVTASDPRK